MPSDRKFNQKITYLSNLKNYDVDRGIVAMMDSRLIKSLLAEEGINEPSEEDISQQKEEFLHDIYLGFINNTAALIQDNEKYSAKETNIMPTVKGLVKKGIPEKKTKIGNYLTYKDFGKLFMKTLLESKYSKSEAIFGITAMLNLDWPPIKSSAIWGWEKNGKVPTHASYIRAFCRFANIDRKVEDHMVSLAAKKYSRENQAHFFSGESQFISR